MNYHLSYALRRGLTFVSVAIVSISVMLYIITFGPALESAIFPVIRYIHAHDIQRGGHLVSFYVSAYKARPCEIITADWYAHSADGNHVWPVVVTYPNRVGPISYPTGPQDTGPYLANINLEGAPFEEDRLDIWAVVFYRCHPGWLVRQDYGPIPVDAAPHGTQYDETTQGMH